jgi:hypothetical protein
MRNMISVHLGISKLNITELNELKEPLAIRNDEVSGSIPLSSTIGFPSDVSSLVRFNASR